MMTKYYATISIKLRCLVEAKDKDDAISKVENMELPKGYVEDSFEIDNVVERNKSIKARGLDDESEMIIIK